MYSDSEGKGSMFKEGIAQLSFPRKIKILVPHFVTSTYLNETGCGASCGAAAAILNVCLPGRPSDRIMLLPPRPKSFISPKRILCMGWRHACSSRGRAGTRVGLIRLMPKVA